MRPALGHSSAVVALSRNRLMLADVNTRKGRYWSTKSCFQRLMSLIFTWHTDWLTLSTLKIIYQAEPPKWMENIFSVQNQTLFIWNQVYNFACIFDILNWHSADISLISLFQAQRSTTKQGHLFSLKDMLICGILEDSTIVVFYGLFIVELIKQL